ncbi:hypothetical protein J437_LFUL008705 [Ladona fulva]|uniref:Uncharacterized protein n=1 Tax=Ladona fulva TaxID=123851 RepID=A0A8K0P4A3_LADFU|nr:hypothetical protein J437_LFUL008705 [Ladona fulva]
MNAMCGDRLWAFERVVGAFLEGFDDREEHNVQTKTECEKLCLFESTFTCRSAEYDESQNICRLSREDRRSQPSAFRRVPGSPLDYLENQCFWEVVFIKIINEIASWYMWTNQYLHLVIQAAREHVKSQDEETRCTLDSVPNSYPRYLDTVLSLVTDEADCERRCKTFADFSCRSFSYYPSGSQCFISGDDRASAGNEASMSRPGTTYYERNCHVDHSPQGLGIGHGFGPGVNIEPSLGPTIGLGFGSGGPERPESAGENKGGGCVASGRPEWEKVSGFELQGQRSVGLLFRDRIPGISAHCAHLCLEDPRCRSFNLHYERNDCIGLEVNSESSGIDLRPTPGVAFFERICLQGCFIIGINTNQCLLSSDASSSVSSGGFQAQSGALYAERECSGVSGGPAGGLHFGGPHGSGPHGSGPHGSGPHGSGPHGSGPHPGGPTYGPHHHHPGVPYGPTDPSVPWPGAPLFGSQPARGPPYGGGPGKFPTSPSTPYPGFVSSIPPRPFEHNEIHGGLYADQEYVYFRGYFHLYGKRACMINWKLDRSKYSNIILAVLVNIIQEPLRTRGNAGVTAECLVECGQQRDRCLAVSLESIRGGRQRCYALDRSADSENAPLQAAPDLGYFQKICLRERPCTKAWVFTRVPSFELVAPSAVEITNVPSRRRCQDECLRSARITCRSATYYGREKLCKVSPDTRRTLPEMFRRTSNDVDYMENECASQPPNCEYTDSPGHFLPYTDRFVPRILEVAECRRLCDQEREFPCRSFNFHTNRRECMLSSDDSFTADKAALIKDRDFFYSERGSCSNVRVDCTQADMLITFSFGSPFDGRVYATGNPQACFEMGNSQSQLVLRIPMGTQCGTVQQNPVIMQNTDKTVRVECRFDASDQTVSYSPKGNREEGGGISVTVPFRPSGTNLVSNTAPTPSVRMRIVMRGGVEATVVGLGEDLQLRIEIDPGSAFGIFARNLEARTDNGELLTLIDNVGYVYSKYSTNLFKFFLLVTHVSICPRDPNIFPALQIERGTRDLYADFKAFRFPSTATVNFVATVQFCQDVCEPIRCHTGVQSFGKRRKRSADLEKNVVEGGEEGNNSNKSKNVTITYVAENSTSGLLEILSSTPKDITTNEPTIRNEVLDTSTASMMPKSSTTDSIPTTTKPREPDLPNELPLQLRLVVGEDLLPKLSKEDATSRRKNKVSIISEPATHPTLSNAEEDEDSGCTQRPLLLTALFITIFLNIAFLVAFGMFYRAKRRQWAKLTGEHSTHGPPHFTPEVLFRSVYDRLQPSPSAFSASLGAMLSTPMPQDMSPMPHHDSPKDHPLHARRK